MMKRSLQAAVAATLLALGSAPALAADVSFTGMLSGDEAVQLFSFSIAGSSNVTLRTWSYAGGVNAAGLAIAAGGFDTLVSLFSGNGSTAILIGANDDGVGVATDPGTGNAFDALLESFSLAAGDYTVALTQFANNTPFGGWSQTATRPVQTPSTAPPPPNDLDEMRKELDELKGMLRKRKK